MLVEQLAELQRMPCKLSAALSVTQEDRPEHGKCDGEQKMGTEKTYIFTFIFSDAEQVLQKPAHSPKQKKVNNHKNPKQNKTTII